MEPQIHPTQIPNLPTVQSFDKKRRMPKWLKIALVAIGVLAVLSVAVYLMIANATQAPQKISDQFINNIQSSNTAAAYALTSGNFQSATTQNQLDALVKQISPSIQGQEKITGRKTVKSTNVPATTVIVYSIETSSGTKYFKTELQVNNGKWQIVNFRSSASPLETSVE